MIALQPESSIKSRNRIEIERVRAEGIPLSQFILDAWPVIEPGRPFVPGKHIDAIAEHLTAVTNKQIYRLLVNMPPRHAKSTIISVLWPVWTWVQDPSHRWLCASYALSLAVRDNVKCRRLILSPWFQEHYGHIFTLTRDQNAKIKFENSCRGYRQAVSVGSSATGEGGDTLLVDDPHSIDEKESDTVRQTALSWFQDTWYTRLNDQQTSAMVVVGQRIHDEDLSGYILKGNTGEEWVHLNLATEFEAESRCVTYLPSGHEFWRDWRTHEGDLLWASRFPKKVLERAKRRHGSLGYAALYQQRPVPASGGTFKKQWLRYFSQEEDHYQLDAPEQPRRVMIEKCQKIITVDLAISQKQSADYTVMSVWAVTPERELLLLDCIRGHPDNPEQQKQVQLLYQRYHPSYIQIENVAYQLAIIQQLLRLGLPVREYKPVKDKVSRASTASVFYESGRVYHPKYASWLQEWEDELLVFPMGAHDDQVDTVSMACDALADKSPRDHIESIQRRTALAQQHALPPTQGTIPTKQKGWWQ